MKAHSDSFFVLQTLIAKDFKIRYRNMSLGIFWSLLNPLVMMTVLTFVFTRLMNSGREYFPIFVLVGLLPYNFFSMAWQSGTTSVIDNSALVKKVPFERALLPIAVVLANSIHYCIQFGLLLLATGVVIGVNANWAWIPLVMAVQVIFVCGLTMLTSALDVYFRDIRYVVESTTLVMFWLVPIFYGFEIVGEEWSWLYEFNPIAAVILIMRSILMDAVTPLSTLSKFIGVTVVVSAIGFFTFSRLQRRFTDYL